MQHARPTTPPGGCQNQSVEQKPESCPLQCKYNFFESDDLTIHTFELKCLDCGWRDTIGYRSDEDDDWPDDPTQCPFCKQGNLPAGINPCDAGNDPKSHVL